MKSSGGSLSPILERHTPQHPLPEGIQKMETDETVCQFCGVSYLIHHEIKKLEDQVKSLEKELVQCRASLENEKKLREELKKANVSIESLQAMLSKKDSVIDRMTIGIEGKQGKLDELNKKNTKLRHDGETLRETIKELKKDVLLQSQSLMKDLNAAKVELTSFKEAVKPIHSEFTQFLMQVRKDMETYCLSFESERTSMKLQISRLQEELCSREKNEDMLQSTIKLMQNEMEVAAKNKDEFANGFKEEKEKLLFQFSSLQSRNAELVERFATVQSQHEMLKSDFEQTKEALSKRHQEVQFAVQKLHKTEKNAELTIQRMDEEIKHLEQDLVSINKEKHKWKVVEENLNKQLEEQQRQMSVNSGESQQIFNSFQNTKQELLALKNERERMIISHQNQIAQLRESFREKLSAASGNPKQLEERLQSMREMHEKEILEMETHLKENFAIEIGVEKEKHEEEMRNCIAKFSELAEQSQSVAKRELQRLTSDSRILQTQISAMKSQHSQERAEQEDEKESLKRLISQLEEKVTSLVQEEDEVAIASRAELQETKRKLQQTMDEKTQLHKQLDLMKEEVAMLQDTVRRECEERFELTEALSVVREQLIRSSKPSSPLLRTPVSAINGLHRQESLHNPKLSSKTLRSLENDGTMGLPQSVLPDVLPRNVKQRDLAEHRASINGDLLPHVKDISFSKQPSPPLGRTLPRTNSEESVESVRRRIATVIKRK